MFRNDFSTAPESLGAAARASTLPLELERVEHLGRVLGLRRVESRSSTTTSLPLASASVSAERRAPRLIFLLTACSWSRGCGPWATPPPAHCGARFEPWRARPVPFWRHGFAPPPGPRRGSWSSACRGGRGEPATHHLVHQRHAHRGLEHLGGRSRVPTFLPATEPTSTFGISDRPWSAGSLDGGTDHHEAAVRARDRALDEQQVCVRRRRWTTSRFSTVTRSLPIWPAIRMPLNTRAGVAHAPIAPGERCLALVPWLRARPLNPWRFIDAGEALALGDADDVGALAGLEDVGPDLLAGLVGRRRRPCGSRRRAGRSARRASRSDPARLGQAVRLASAPKRELHRRVAVLLLGLDLRDEARPGLDDRDRDRRACRRRSGSCPASSRGCL